MFTITKYQLVYSCRLISGGRREFVLSEYNSLPYAVRILRNVAALAYPGDIFCIRVKTQLCEFIKEN